MRKGFSVAIIIIVLSIFGAILLGYIGYISESTTNNVKGASAKNNINSGFSVMINSSYTWDFYEYLCKDKDECKTSLTSGKKYASISGGSVKDHELAVSFVDQWGDYDFIKLFMKPSSGNMYESYSVNKIFTDDQLEQVAFDNQSGSKTNAIIIPIKLIESNYLEHIAEFIGN